MRRFIWMVLATLLVSGAAWGAIGDQPYGFDMILNSYQQINYRGEAAWEYVYDCYLQLDSAGRTADIYNIYLHGVDPAGILNMYRVEDGGDGNFYDFWGSGHAGITAGSYFGPIWNVHAPSFGLRDTDTWVINPTQQQQDDFHWNYDANFAATNGTLNTWHAPTDYGHNEGFSSWTYNGATPYDFTGPGGTPDGVNDGLHFFYGHWGATGWSEDPELILTIRLVHQDGPAGEVNLRFDNGYGGNKDAGTAVGPAPGWTPGGDFDGDGDIDADDVDILCANMGGDPGAYDVDGNGVVDEDDMIYHITNLVEYDTDGDGTADGTGSYRGDFNLDGVVNATDLQIMKAGFGLSGVGYAAGNANCDVVVNATDLQILKANFGLAASAVPEPITLGLLSLGGVALLRRR